MNPYSKRVSAAQMVVRGECAGACGLIPVELSSVPATKQS